MFSWILRSALTLALGLSLIGCSFSASSTDAVCYGSLPQLVDLPEATYTAWVYPTAYTKETVMSGWVDGQGGFAIYLGGGAYVSNGVIQVVYYHIGGGGQWVTTETVPLNTWSHIAVSIKNDTSNPKIYINGVLANTNILIVPAISYNGTPIGAVGSLAGMDWCIGNVHGQTGGTDFKLPFSGKIKDARVYNRILSDAEIANLDAGNNITDGLVFKSFMVRTPELSNFDNTTLNSKIKVLDGIHGAIGTAYGSPVTFLP